MPRYLCTLIGFLFLCIQADGQNYKWGHVFGGSAGLIGVDGLNNIYVCGVFEDTVDFNPGAATYSLQSTYSDDIFLSKFTAAGKFVWAQKLGSKGLDLPYDMAVNKTGIFIAGNQGYSFARYNAYGALLWTRSITAMPQSVALDTLGNAYVAGVFGHTVNFDPGITNITVAAEGNSAFFVLKIGENGIISWIIQYPNEPGMGWPRGIAVAVDPEQNVIISCGFNDTLDVDPGPNVTKIVPNGGSDVVVMKLDPEANLKWFSQMTFPCFQYGGKSVVSDHLGNIYAGVQSDSDMVVCKLSASGQTLWHRVIGGPGTDRMTSIAVDKQNNVFTAGAFEKIIDLDPGPGSYALTSENSMQSSCFISGLDSAGNFRCGARVAGRWPAMAIDNMNDIVMSGSFTGSIDLDPGSAVQTFSSDPKKWGSYLVKLESCAVPFLTHSPAEEKQEIDLLISPNPAQGSFTLRSGETPVTVAILDQLGRVCMENRSGGTTTEFDISDLSPGIYYLVVITANAQETRKIVVQ